MRNFQEKRIFKNIIQSWPVLIFLSILLVFFAFGIFRFMMKMGETVKNRKLAETRILELQESKEKLSNDIMNLKTKKGLEENIREKFGLAKEGEGLIIVVDNKEISNSDNEKKENWFILLFKNWFK